MSGDTAFLYISLCFNLAFAIISLLKSVRKCKTYCCEYTTNGVSGEGEEAPKTNRFQQIIQKITPRPQKEISNPTQMDSQV
jgi:hypothetical protein